MHAFPEPSPPFKVLECIRHRHGLQDFAGGRLLLDPEYECYEVAAGAASAPEDNEGKGLLFPGLRLLHAEPILIGVDDFFSSDECDEYISKSVSPPLREYVSRAGMGPFEQPAALDSGQVSMRCVRGDTCLHVRCESTQNHSFVQRVTVVRYSKRFGRFNWLQCVDFQAQRDTT